MGAGPPVDFLDESATLAVDRHEGFAGSNTSDNVYRLEARGEVAVRDSVLLFQACGDRDNPDTNGVISVRADGGNWREVGEWTNASCTEALNHDNWQRLPLERAPDGLTARTLQARFEYTAGAERLLIYEVRWLGTAPSPSPSAGRPRARPSTSWRRRWSGWRGGSARC